MPSPRRASAVATLALGLTLLASASPMAAADPGPVVSPSGGPAATSVPAPSTIVDVASAVLTGLLDGRVATTIDAVVSDATSNPCSGSGSLRKSANGSLTVLLLGSDYRRKPYIGERTDTVIAMNIARTGRVTMAAIPRDTVRVPLASGGSSGPRRINALYIGYKRRSVGAHAVDCAALDKVRRDVARALGTSIPYYAMVRMDEFQWLLQQIGGIRMDIRGTLIDTHYRRNSRKIYVPKRDAYQMNGVGDCGAKPKLCRNALKYARSRYGTEGGTANSDFRRVRRQQEIVFFAIKRVLARGNGPNLMALLGAAKGRIYTNLPKSMSGALALYSFAKGARFREQDGKVFGPTRWASYTGTYTFQLRLHDVRQWVDHHFKP